MKKILCQCFALFGRVKPCFQSAVLLFLRITIGWTFFLTGRGKLRHFEGTTEFFQGLGLPAPAFHAGLVGYTEMIGGLMLVAGLAARFVSVPLAISMIVAYATVHMKDVADITDFVDQKPYAFLAVTLVIMAFGAGKFSLDGLLCRLCKSRCKSSGCCVKDS